MDWKRFYARELAGGEGRAAVERAFAGAPPVDPVLDDALARGVVSFPHTYLGVSALPLARVVDAIYRSIRERRVVKVEE